MNGTAQTRRAQENHSCASLFLSSFFASPGCSRLLLGLLLLASLGLSGCKKLPPGKDAIDSVHVRGEPKGTSYDIHQGIATRKTKTLLGVRRVYEYETLDDAELERDIERIERTLRRRGYYQGRVTATRVIRSAENRVRVEFEVTAGEPTRVLRLETTGLAELPEDVIDVPARVRKRLLDLQAIFDEDEYELYKSTLADELADRGYAYVEVTGHAEVDLATNSANIKIHVVLGPRCRLGEITIDGLDKLKEKSVRRVLGLKKGQRFSRKDLRLTRGSLFSLGLFSKVQVEPQLGKSKNPEIPIVVRLSESTFRDVTIGAGARLDMLRLAAVSELGWTHRNFLGGLRKFSATTRPGLTFFPTSIEQFRAPTRVFPENFATLRLEQPGFFEARTSGFVEGGYNIYPLLYPIPEDQNIDELRVIGYNEVTTAIGVDHTFFGTLLSTTLSLNWQANFPFNYQLGTSSIPGLDEVVVAYPELRTIVDLRDDPISPTKGFYFSNSFQSALPFLGGDLIDFRIKPEVRTFIPLDHDHKVILATRFGAGMVFPSNYGDALLTGDAADKTQDQHRLLFRAFYSGGPSSNRGYPYRRIGPQGEVSFLVPSTIDCEATPEATECLRPLGGFTMWEASAEVRWTATKSWRFVGFVDASDVDTGVASFNFLEPHISVGPGVRYLSPVGPVRLDVGWRVPGLQSIRPRAGEPLDVSQVAPYVDQTRFGRQLSLNILIGEDF